MSKYKNKYSQLAVNRKNKYASKCGASGGEGAPGFQPGNSCGGNGDGSNTSGDQGGGDKPHRKREKTITDLEPEVLKMDVGYQMVNDGHAEQITHEDINDMVENKEITKAEGEVLREYSDAVQASSPSSEKERKETIANLESEVLKMDVGYQMVNDTHASQITHEDIDDMVENKEITKSEGEVLREYSDAVQAYEDTGSGEGDTSWLDKHVEDQAEQRAMYDPDVSDYTEADEVRDAETGAGENDDLYYPHPVTGEMMPDISAIAERERQKAGGEKSPEQTIKDLEDEIAKIEGETQVLADDLYKDISHADIDDMLEEKDITQDDAKLMREYVDAAQAQADSGAGEGWTEEEQAMLDAPKRNDAFLALTQDEKNELVANNPPIRDPENPTEGEGDTEYRDRIQDLATEQADTGAGEGGGDTSWLDKHVEDQAEQRAMYDPNVADYTEADEVRDADTGAGEDMITGTIGGDDGVDDEYLDSVIAELESREGSGEGGMDNYETMVEEARIAEEERNTPRGLAMENLQQYNDFLNDPPQYTTTNPDWMNNQLENYGVSEIEDLTTEQMQEIVGIIEGTDTGSSEGGVDDVLGLVESYKEDLLKNPDQFGGIDAVQNKIDTGVFANKEELRDFMVGEGMHKPDEEVVNDVWDKMQADTGAGEGGGALSKLNSTDRQMAELEIEELTENGDTFDSKSEVQEYLDNMYGSPGEGVSSNITDAIWEGVGGDIDGADRYTDSSDYGDWSGTDVASSMTGIGYDQADRTAEDMIDQNFHTDASAGKAIWLKENADGLNEEYGLELDKRGIQKVLDSLAQIDEKHQAEGSLSVGLRDARDRLLKDIDRSWNEVGMAKEGRSDTGSGEAKGRPRGAPYIENSRFWDLPKNELQYIIKDASEAIEANPEASKATTGPGNWSDQVNDAYTALAWLKKKGV